MSDKDFEFSAVIASAVHDMKNSLGMLLGALDEIMNRCEPEQCPSLSGFSHLRYEGNRVNNSLLQLLSLYRIRNQEYDLNITENDVEECLEECFLESQGLLEMKGIQTSMDCEPELMWYFDRGMIVGLLNSVINNSYKYTKDQINIHAHAQDNYLVITVEDNGSGYPPSMIHKDAGHRPDIDFKSGSTGLGLFFASQLSALHTNRDRTGFITTSNEGIDGGGCFSIFLP